MKQTIENIYLHKVNQITKHPFHYLSINPTSGLKSLNQFRFLIKKSMRDYSKIIGLNLSHQYLNYISVIEVNPSITQGNELFNGKFPKKRTTMSLFGMTEVLFEPTDSIDEMGYHTHLFMNINQQTHIQKIREVWRFNFKKQGIELDWYDTPSHEIQSINRFIRYHTKQIKDFDHSFLVM